MMPLRRILLGSLLKIWISVKGYSGYINCEWADWNKIVYFGLGSRNCTTYCDKCNFKFYCYTNSVKDLVLGYDSLPSEIKTEIGLLEGNTSAWNLFGNRNVLSVLKPQYKYSLTKKLRKLEVI
jgi:hypothetical protein